MILERQNRHPQTDSAGNVYIGHDQQGQAWYVDLPIWQALAKEPTWYQAIGKAEDLIHCNLVRTVQGMTRTMLAKCPSGVTPQELCDALASLKALKALDKAE